MATFSTGGDLVKKLVCELCGGNAFTKGDDGLFICEYCRTKYTPAQAQSMMVEGTVRVDRSGEVGNLLALANNALNSNNNQEALDFSNKVLEIDPHNSAAWYVKGTAAGWLSNLKNLRIAEMINAFQTALQFSPENENDDLKSKCGEALISVGVACSNLSLEHTDKFASVDGAWGEHVNRCRQIISAFKVSYAWHPCRKSLDNIITVASNLIVGATYKYWDSAWNTERTGVRELPESDKREMQSIIDWASGEVKKIDPDFVTPKPQTQTGCFVITATMGNAESLPVVALREFRDVILVDYTFGRRFVSWYYKFGPRIADYIEPSLVLRFLSLALIVIPCTAIALLLLQIRRPT